MSPKQGEPWVEKVSDLTLRGCCEMGNGYFPLMPSHSVGCLATSHPMPEVPTQSSMGALELTLVLCDRWMGERGWVSPAE